MLLRLTLALAIAGCCAAQDIVTVRPQEIDDVLLNPGIGFMTFQRFNGDDLNQGTRWTEGYPIEYQPFRGSLENKNHPPTSIAYFRVYWKFIEPEDGKFRWDLIDVALKTAQERGQTLMLRIAPYGTTKDNDVPAWYRALTGEDPALTPGDKKWRVDPENPHYARRFGGMVRALGSRYDGHPGLELVDISIVGAWGEGAGSDKLSQKVREALLDAYLESFRKTPLAIQPTDEKTNGYANAKAPVGWRVDCLGDMGGFSPTWNHMFDYYPQAIVNFGLRDAWKTRPVTMEVCWVMQTWKDKGWDIDYIIDQSLKWHISSFNAKSSAVPEEWRPQVDRWLKKMGYRFVLRKLTFPRAVAPGTKLPFTSWWENKGVAPPYRQFPLALRLKNAAHETVLETAADVRTWLPGDSLYDDSVLLPAGVPEGEYELALGLLDPVSRRPGVKLAIAGRDAGGWYPLGQIQVRKSAAGLKLGEAAPEFRGDKELVLLFGSGFANSRALAAHLEKLETALMIVDADPGGRLRRAYLGDRAGPAAVLVCRKGRVRRVERVESAEEVIALVEQWRLGKLNYGIMCERCHGEDGGSEYYAAAPPLNGIGNRLTPTQIRPRMSAQHGPDQFLTRGFWINRRDLDSLILYISGL